MTHHPPKPTTTTLTDFLVRADHAEPWHNRRYVMTFEASWSEMSRARRILDVGGRSPYTDMLDTFTSAAVTNTQFDLRTAFPHDDGVFDVVCCLEVVEHLKDRDSSDPGVISTFTFSGIRNCLKEIWRVLRPGGLLVLSTPNVCSYRSIRNALEHRHPFAYAPHNRELALSDVRHLLSEAQFSIERLDTIDAWSYRGDIWSRFRIALVLMLLGYSVRNRQDDILVLARRPP